MAWVWVLLYGVISIIWGSIVIGLLDSYFKLERVVKPLEFFLVLWSCLMFVWFVFGTIFRLESLLGL